MYAVVDSVAKIAAGGGDISKIRMTYQEYFQRMTENPKTWGQPFSALLGAYDAQLGFGLPSIGGKDSMSGSFNDIHVPPTLVSFAVDVATDKNMITPELKKAGNVLVYFPVTRNEEDLPDYEELKTMYGDFFSDVEAGRIQSAYALGARGIAEAVSKMSFGNRLGVKLSVENLDSAELFAPEYGALIAEVRPEDAGHLKAAGRVIGEVTADGTLSYGDTKVALQEAVLAWTRPLEKVFPSVSGQEQPAVDTPVYSTE